MLSSKIRCFTNSGFQKNLFQHAKYKLHLKYKVQSTISRCVKNRNGRQAAGHYNANCNNKKDDDDTDNDDTDDDNTDDDEDNDDTDDNDMDNNDYKDNGNDKDDGDNMDDGDNKDNKAGEIIPILISTLAFTFSMVTNEAVILLDLEVLRYFRLSRCQMCRPYVALFLIDLNNC